jgi:hypothetical protein
LVHGPFTEIHLLIFKLICESEIQNRSIAMKQENYKISASEEAFKQRQDPSSYHASENFEEQDSCDKPLRDVLLLLKACDLEPSYLLQKESRELIEENLTFRKGPLPAEHLAVLQLLSKAEIDSNIPMDSMRKRLLENRIKEGPLNPNYLSVVQYLSKCEGVPWHSRSPMKPLKNEDMMVLEKLKHNLKYLPNLNQYESSELTDDASSQAVSSRDCFLVQESKAPFLMNTIHGTEVRTSLLSRRDKSVLQLIELKAKTASIRQSLPEWVRNSLVPPQQNPFPSQLSPPHTVLVQPTDHHVSRDAIIISCDVRADIGFLNDFLLPDAQSKLEGKTPTSFLFDVEQCSDINSDKPEFVSSWQGEQLAGQDLRQSPAPQLSPEIGTLLTRLFCTLAQCITCCLQAMLSFFKLCPVSCQSVKVEHLVHN